MPMAINWISTSAICARKCGSSISGLPLRRSARATALSRDNMALAMPIPAIVVRSWVSRYLAQVQPSFSRPTRFFTGTRTLSRNTSLT
ncbi:hypothetical protein D3C84_937270 [compost metagenome]